MPKTAYRVRNWKEYNEGLVKRGSITFWFDEELVKSWKGEKRKAKVRGRPQKYSDQAIVCGLTLKVLFKMTFRMTEGLMRSLIECLKLEIEAPDYSLLCKRQSSVKIDLPRSYPRGENLHILVDTTGLKVLGEGEWKVRQHGWMKHRLWRKLHLAVDGETQEIEAFELTDLGRQDCEGFARLVGKIKGSIHTAIGDGAYDRFSCYELGEQKQFQLITPPQRNARTSKERRVNKKKASAAGVKKRDEVIEKVREMGRQEWKIASGYHRRSLAETAMFRIKTLLGNKLTTKKMENQIAETAIGCRIINKMTALGMPESVAI